MQLSGWQIVEDEHGRLRLRAQLRMKSFLKALALCDRIAEVAEAEGHHPDIHITGWNRVALELWTHARNGLTEVRLVGVAGAGQHAGLGVWGAMQGRCLGPAPGRGQADESRRIQTSQNDFIMAAKIDAIPKADLLGGKRPKFADI